MAPEVYRIRHGWKPARRNRKLRAHIHNCQCKVDEQTESKGVFLLSKPTPSGILPPAKSLLNCPKQHHQLETRHSNIWSNGDVLIQAITAAHPSSLQVLVFLEARVLTSPAKEKNILHLPLNAPHFSPISHKLPFFPKDKAY